MARRCSLRVHEVEPHLDEAEAEMKILPRLHARLNKAVDELATPAAQRVKLRAAEVKVVLEVDQRAARGCQQYAAFLQNARDKSERLPRQPREAGR